MKWASLQKLRRVPRRSSPWRFGGRSATSRGFEASSSPLSLDHLEIIDPSGGLRRKTSVALAHGDIALKYNTEIKLGEGSFGTVMRVTDILTKEAFALKIIGVQNLKDTQRFEQELAISRMLKHPNIITLHETFMEGAAYHLVMEMCTGGDLHHKITRRTAVPGNFQAGMSARRVAAYAWQILAGVAYLHQYCFVHRDIKPENYLLSDSTDGATIKLIDFGLARECKWAEKMTSRVGTPHYVAPEVVADTSTGYTANCDVWSIGVTLWFVSIGSLPFVGKDETATLKAVVRGKYDFSSPLWAEHKHPQELMQMIGRMLLKDAELRPHAKSIMRDDAWLKANTMLADSKKAVACCNIA